MEQISSLCMSELLPVHLLCRGQFVSWAWGCSVPVSHGVQCWEFSALLWSWGFPSAAQPGVLDAPPGALCWQQLGLGPSPAPAWLVSKPWEWLGIDGDMQCSFRMDQMNSETLSSISRHCSSFNKASVFCPKSRDFKVLIMLRDGGSCCRCTLWVLRCYWKCVNGYH